MFKRQLMSRTEECILLNSERQREFPFAQEAAELPEKHHLKSLDINNRNTRSWPWLAALCSGVAWSLSWAFTSAPLFSNRWTILNRSYAVTDAQETYINLRVVLTGRIMKRRLSSFVVDIYFHLVETKKISESKLHHQKFTHSSEKFQHNLTTSDRPEELAIIKGVHPI